MLQDSGRSNTTINEIADKITYAKDSFDKFNKTMRILKRSFHIKWSKILQCKYCYSAIVEFVRTGDHTQLTTVPPNSIAYVEAKGLYNAIEKNGVWGMLIPQSIYSRQGNDYRRLARAALRRRGVKI